VLLSLEVAPSAHDGSVGGRVLGDFVVGERLGAGAFGTVYRARQARLGRDVVVKILHGTPTGPRLARFLREAKLASRLDHPYAAHVYAFDLEDDGTAWIAMELVAGTPVSELLRVQGAMPLGRLVPFMEKLCEVVATAHELGIVHRDLKPANVMVVARAGQLLPKLLDLGIAKQLGERDEDSAAAAGAPLTGFAPDAPTASGSQPPAAALAPASGRGFAATVDATLGLGPSGAAVTAAPVAEGATTDRPAPPGLGTGPEASAALGDEDAGAAPLTAHGAVLGSPHYMAPEQWDGAEHVDARTDLYALAVMAWELCTGRVPFVATTIPALAEAHRRAPLPALPPHFPAGLGDFFARALAKRPSERPQTALAFARELRRAAGLDGQGPPLPRLADGLRTKVLAGAPQPIAEAVAGLESAHNPHQAREALVRVVETVTHLLGVWALAARTRSAPPGGDPAEVAELLRTLRSDGLDGGGWLDLAAALCRPFATCAEAHPLPELVGFVTGAGPALVAAAQVPARGAALDESAVHAELARALPALERLLGALDFLAAYPVVVVRHGTPERWMGVRRPTRAAVVTSEAIAPGQATLVDGEGAPLVVLAPLAQVAEPMAGAPPELFLLAGPGRHGARLVARPTSFEREDDAPWSTLVTTFRATLEDEGLAAPVEAEPYLGLEPFTTADAARYIGREAEVDEFVNRLRHGPLACVVGPSGAGKSSFVHAGVVPALPAGWSALSVRPGATPLAVLARRLELGGAEPSAAVFTSALSRRAGDGVLVLVVDQLEELFTLCPNAAERERLAGVLAAAAQGPKLRIVLTLRDDFLLRAAALPRLGASLGAALVLLAPPTPTDLRRILVTPARRAGYRFEDDALADEMVAEVATAIAPLPLLSFAAAKLWAMRDRHFRRLDRKAYLAIGGVGGALARHAEATLESLGAQEQGLARRAFLALVTAAGTRAVLGTDALLELLGGGERARVVLEKLLAARLLASREDEHGAGQIELLHEALIGAWPRLVAWRHEDAEATRLRDQLRAAARQWHERGQSRGLLWRGEALAEYRAFRARARQPLPAIDAAFLAASLADEARGRRVRLGLAAGAFVLLATAVVLLYRANMTSQGQRRVAQRAERSATASADAMRKAKLAQAQELGRLAMLAGDPMRALPYLSEVYSAGVDTPALRVLIAQALRGLPEVTVTHDGWIVDLDVRASDGAFVTCGADGRVRLWTQAGRRLHDWAGPGELVWACGLSPDGALVLAAGTSGHVLLLDAETGAERLRLAASSEKLYAASFSPDGSQFAAAGKDGHVRLFDRVGRPLLDLDTQRGPVRGLAFAPDGTRLIAWGYPGNVVSVWDARRGRRLSELVGHTDTLWSAAIDPSGTQVATASEDGTVRVWDATRGRERLRLRGHRGPVYAIAYAPDGRSLVSAGGDRTARLWDTVTGQPGLVLDDGDAALAGAVFSPDGERILTLGYDGRARLYDLQSGSALRMIHGHVGRVSQAYMAPHGESVITASNDGTARIWRLHRDAEPLRLAEAQGEARFVAAAATGTAIAISDGDAIEIWDASEPRRVSRLEPEIGHLGGVTFFPDGTRLAVIGSEGRAAIVDMLGKRARVDIRQSSTIWAAATSPEGAYLATGDDSGVTKIWRGSDGLELASWPVAQAAIVGLQYSPDGAHLAVSSADGIARVIDTTSGTAPAFLARLAGGTATFDPARSRVVTTPNSDRNVAIVWDLATGTRLLELEGHGDVLTSAHFTRNGELLVTASFDGSAKLWDAASGNLLASLIDQRVPVLAALSLAGDSFLTASMSGDVSVSRLETTIPNWLELQRITRCKCSFRLENDILISTAPEPSACASPAQ
jgi:WD40 repeat protein/serine/threonine protein kinase